MRDKRKTDNLEEHVLPAPLGKQPFTFVVVVMWGGGGQKYVAIICYTRG